MSTNSSPDEEAVTLYLISKFLGSNPKFSKTHDSLVEAIERHGLLGSTQDWTENVRPKRLQDFDRKFHRLPRDQLLGHLKNSIRSLPDINISKSTRTPGSLNHESLLLPLGGILDLSTEKALTVQSAWALFDLSIEKAVTAVQSGWAPIDLSTEKALPVQSG